MQAEPRPSPEDIAARVKTALGKHWVGAYVTSPPLHQKIYPGCPWHMYGASKVNVLNCVRAQVRRPGRDLGPYREGVDVEVARVPFLTPLMCFALRVRVSRRVMTQDSVYVGGSGL